MNSSVEPVRIVQSRADSLLHSAMKRSTRNRGYYFVWRRYRSHRASLRSELSPSYIYEMMRLNRHAVLCYIAGASLIIDVPHIICIYSAPYFDLGWVKQQKNWLEILEFESKANVQKGEGWSLASFTFYDR